MNSVLLTRTIEFLLLPPGNLLILLLLLFWLRHYSWLFKSLLILGTLQILLLSSPWFANFLMDQLKNQYPVKANLWEQSTKPQAIVVLGAGRNSAALDYGGESTSLAGLERLRYAALLYRHTQLPILLTGGSPQEDKVSEAELMRVTLEQEFKIPVKWLETNSHTTWENAEFTDDILQQAGIQTAWLVTQGWHMPRALYAFSNRNVTYLPAPTSFGANISWVDGLTRWIPQSTALSNSIIALHEYVGLFWYRWRESMKKSA